MSSSYQVCFYLGVVLASFISHRESLACWAFQPASTSGTLRDVQNESSSPSWRLFSNLGDVPSPPERNQLSSSTDAKYDRRGGSLTLLGGSSNNRGSTGGQLHKDVVIVGGGLAGLSVALHLSQLDPTRQITILERTEMLESPTGSFAAAGMLAPQSERLPKGQYLDLCLASKRLFPDFCQQVERLAREAGEEGAPYLIQDPEEEKKENGLKPWNIGYLASGGFLAPAFAGDNVATWAPPEDSKGTAMWLDAIQVRELEPNLSRDVVGGWWFPEDASVDARRLACSLKAACIGAGVQLLCGKNYEVSSLDLEEGKCKGLWLKSGKYIATNDLLVANGAWMRNLLPVPIEPHKGQSISLRMPKDQPPILRRVLFGQDSYIVPKADGRIVIGATVEAGSYDGKVTPAGIMHILSYALEVLPGLADLPLEETWAGLRPTTPDKGPILGKTPWDNLYLAGGYWRNGVLLAPKTGELLAKLIAGVPLIEEDQSFLKAFAWDRFTSPEGGTALAANARYAASMYPVHQRKSGVGVAASVGTELGSYSTAASAAEERRKDRESLWEDNDDALEKAALMGKQDASVFSFDDDGSKAWKAPHPPTTEELPHVAKEPNLPVDIASLTETTLPHFLAINPDLKSAASLNASSTPSVDDLEEESRTNRYLQRVYDKIRQQKAVTKTELNEAVPNDRPDPGFRIYHIDKENGKKREVPPYTSPAEFLKSIESKESASDFEIAVLDRVDRAPEASAPEGYSEKTYDGYQAILEASSSRSEDEQREAMREARRQNRIDAEGNDIF